MKVYVSLVLVAIFLGIASSSFADNCPIPFPDEGSICGDGKLQIFEECDHGKENNGKTGDICSANCVLVPTALLNNTCFFPALFDCRKSHCKATANGNPICGQDFEACVKSAQDNCKAPETSQPSTPSQPCPAQQAQTPASDSNFASVTDTTAKSPANSNQLGQLNGSGCSLSETMESFGFGEALAYALLGLAPLTVFLRRTFLN